MNSILTHESSKTIIIRATKPNLDSKIGINISVKNDVAIITGINEDSIFATNIDVDGDNNNNKLKVGHEVVKINGASVAGKDSKWVSSMLKSNKNLAFEVNNSWTATFRLEIKNVRKQETGEVIKRYSQWEMNCQPGIIPTFLEGRGVALSEWQRMFALLDGELRPCVSKSIEMDRRFNHEIEQKYVQKQMVKGGVIGFGTESRHEKMVYKMTRDCAALANSAVLVATNVLVLINAMMVKHNVVCQLHLETYNLPKWSNAKQDEKYTAVRVHGIEFIDY